MDTDKLIVFLSTWALISISILFLSGLFSSQIVFSQTYISVILSFFFTLICLMSPSTLKKIDSRITDSRYSIAVTFVALVPIIWIVKKVAIYSGLGIQNNVFVLLLAAIAAAVGYYGFKYSEHFLKKIQ